MAYYIPQEIWREIMSYFVSTIEDELNTMKLSELYSLHNTYCLTNKILYNSLPTTINLVERRKILMRPIIQFHHKTHNIIKEIQDFKNAESIKKNKERRFNTSLYNVGLFIQYHNEIGIITKVYKTSIHCNMYVYSNDGIFGMLYLSQIPKRIIRENVNIISV